MFVQQKAMAGPSLQDRMLDQLAIYALQGEFQLQQLEINDCGYTGDLPQEAGGIPQLPESSSKCVEPCSLDNLEDHCN